MAALEQFGRYRAVRRLGVGAFATVWLARDEQLDGPVAVKVLADNWASRGDVRERFLEEARMLRRADSDRVVRVHDIGELDDGRPYFVMTYADRGILADRLTDFPMPLAEALWYAHETALGVAVLHARGIIHRDVKPSNVLLRTVDGAGEGYGEQVLVSDLGLAKAAAIASGITLTAGTPGYMPPEQAHGVGLTFASDVYALGALTYRMVAGRLPHQVGSPLSVLSTAADPVPALEFSAGLPRELDAVLRRALSRDPADRQADAQAFARALSGAAGGSLAAGAVRVPDSALLGGSVLLGDRDSVGSAGSVAGAGSVGRAGSVASAGSVGVAGSVGGGRGTALSTGWDRDDLATVITRTRPVDVGPTPPVDAAPPPRSRRGRTAALLCLLIVAVVLSGGLVAAVAEPGWVDQARAVLAGNRVVQRQPLTVTVPAAWSQLGAVAGTVPGMGRPAEQLTVSEDLGSYRSATGAPGVFVAVAAGREAARVRAAVRYPGCTGPVPQRVDAPAGWNGTAAGRRCGTTRVLTWVGTDGVGRTLVVEVKVGSHQQALADRVLSSVAVAPAAGS